MTFTWGEILEEVRGHVNEPTAAFFTDTYILSQFNAIQRMFAMKVRSLRKRLQVGLQADNETFIVPSDFLGLISAGLVSADNRVTWLKPLSMEGRSIYSIDQIGFFQVDTQTYRVYNPETAFENNIDNGQVGNDDDQKIELVYYALPTPFADETDLGQETDIPDRHIDTVIMGVVSRCFKKRRDFDDAQFAMQDYQLGIQDAIRFESIRLGAKKQIIIQ